MIALLSAAFGQACDPSGLAAPPEALSVAWVSPVGRRVGASRWLWVVPTRELRAFAGEQGVGRTLQWLGIRRRDRDPGRRWKVVVFDVTPADLCRPVTGAAEGTMLGGVAACDERRTPDPDRRAACGTALDRSTGRPSVPVYRAEWAALAANGFCVLPMERITRGE